MNLNFLSFIITFPQEFIWLIVEVPVIVGDPFLDNRYNGPIVRATSRSEP
jgi:hypothetical protein